MSAELTYHEIEELLPSYVLGALEPEEMLVVDDYVQTHPKLRLRLHELEETVRQLAYAVSDEAPPVSIKQSVLDYAQADLSTPKSMIHPVSAAPPAQAEPNLRPSARQQSGQNAPAPNWLAGWQRWSLALGSALLVLLVLSLYLGQQAQLNQVKDQLKTIQVTMVELEQQVKDNQSQEQLQAMQATITGLEEQIQDNQQVLEQIASADPMVQAQLEQAAAQLETIEGTVGELEQQVKDNQRVLELVATADLNVPLARTDLLTTEIALEASATYFQSGPEAVLVVRGLEPLPPEQTYQLWLVVDGQPTPVPQGLLSGTELGTPGSLLVSIPPEMQEFTIVDVSVEPAGGSENITKAAVILRGSVN